MTKVTATITREEMTELGSRQTPVPFVVRLRLLLNEKGIRFADDGKLSQIANVSPVPLGQLSIDKNNNTGTETYTQVIED